MVYPAKVTELKRLSPHASVEMRRTQPRPVLLTAQRSG